MLSAQHSAWADILARSLQCTNKLMSAWCYGCLQTNSRINLLQLQSFHSFTAGLFNGLVSLQAYSGKDGQFEAESKIADFRKGAAWCRI